MALAGVAAVTKRVTVGLMVGANTFRVPGLTAKLATTLDHISDGRAILGIGGAWFEREHDGYGIDFGTSVGERLDRFDESVGILRRLLDGERFSHEGTLLHAPRRVVRAAPGAGTPADAHRRLREAQDAPDRGASTRTRGTRPGRSRTSARTTPSSASTARPSAAISRRSSGRSASPSSSGPPGRRHWRASPSCAPTTG